jgi:hypothetical protein
MKCVCIACSQYSLQYSKKQPHAASIEAKTKVEQQQKQLVNAPVLKGIVGDLALLKGVPLRSLALLVCKLRIKSEVAVDYYPRRPPLTVDVQKAARIADGRSALPIFLVHFS